MLVTALEAQVADERVSALTAALRNHRGRQDGVSKALGIEGATVIWKRED